MAVLEMNPCCLVFFLRVFLKSTFCGLPVTRLCQNIVYTYSEEGFWHLILFAIYVLCLLFVLFVV